MKVDGKEMIVPQTIRLQINGLGMIMYSPKSVTHISPGENYFKSNFGSGDQAMEHLKKGSILGLNTGTGDFNINVFWHPPPAKIAPDDIVLAFAIIVDGGAIIFRDLEDLTEWEPMPPPNQTVMANDGIYHLTLWTRTPHSGIIGDNQDIDVFIKPIDKFPSRFGYTGVPSIF